jgi:hypothetical protein
LTTITQAPEPLRLSIQFAISGSTTPVRLPTALVPPQIFVHFLF